MGKYDALTKEELVRLMEARDRREATRFGLVWEAGAEPEATPKAVSTAGCKKQIPGRGMIAVAALCAALCAALITTAIALRAGGKVAARAHGQPPARILGTLATPVAPRTVKVAAVQFISKMADPAGNRQGLARKVRAATGNGAKIVVLPETAITGYMSTDLKTTWQAPGWPLDEHFTGLDPSALAERVPGESTRVFGALAKELEIYLTVPLLELDPKSGRFFNALVLVGPDGQLLLHYRKLNPWPFAESSWATPGDRGHQYVDTPYGRLSLLICYDINFEPPKLALAKIDTLLYAIAWVDDPGSRWFEENLPAIARKNDMNIIGANWAVGDTPDWFGYGQSRIISRTGEILARCKQDVGEDILYAELAVPTR